MFTLRPHKMARGSSEPSFAGDLPKIPAARACAWLIFVLLTTLHAPPARAVWQPTEFLIGATAWTSRLNADPDTSLFGRRYRIAARAGVNLMFPGAEDDPSVVGNFAHELRTAAALGIRLMKPYYLDGSADTLTRPPGVTSTEWDNFIGYWVDHGRYIGDHISPPSETSMGEIHEIHASGKIAYGNEIIAGSILNWMEADSVDRPDMWSYEFYLNNSYENNLSDPCYPGPETCLHFPLHDYHQLWAAPASVLGFTYVSGDAYNEPELLNPATLMPMAFLPVALGARGIVWSQMVTIAARGLFGGFANEEDLTNMSPAVIEPDIPTPWFWELRRVNRYLRQVVGPSIMKCDYLWGLNHAAWTSGPEPFIYNHARFLPGTDKPFFRTSADIPVNFLVSIWKPRGAPTPADPESTFYLFIVNKDLHTTSPGTLSMHAGRFYSVAAAPSAIGYEAGSGFTPISVSHSPPGADFVTSFAITLAPGEGRLYKVVPSSTGADLAGLASPVGGESWNSGETKTISWTGISSDAVVRLLLDEPRPDAPEGPILNLAGPVSGGSCVITVPAVSSSRARIEVSGYITPGGAFTRVTHAVPLRIATGVVRENVGGYRISWNAASAFLDLATNSQGQVRVLYTGGPTSRDFRARLWELGNPSEILPDRVPGAPVGSGYYGVTPAMVIDAAGVTHIAYCTVFEVEVPDSIYPVGAAQVIRYFRKTSAGWAAPEVVAPVGNALEGCAIAIGSDGEPLVAYNAGSFGQYRLRVAKRDATGNWTDLGVAGFPGSHDPSIAIDAEGNVWVASVSEHPTSHAKLLTIGQGWEEPGWGFTLSAFQGATGPAAMQIGSDGYPEVASIALDASTGSQSLVLRRFELINESWTNVTETVDASAKGVSGLAISRDGSQTCIAYASNGVLREAVRQGSQNWSIFDVVRQSDVHGPIGFSVTPAGVRWYSFWDKAQREIWTAYHFPQGSPEEEPDDPGEILPAIEFDSPNPVVRGGAISLALRLAGAAVVDLALYDVAGRRVSSRAAERIEAGISHLSWSPASPRPGVHFLRVRIDGREAMTKRIVFLN